MGVASRKTSAVAVGSCYRMHYKFLRAKVQIVLSSFIILEMPSCPTPSASPFEDIRHWPSAEPSHFRPIVGENDQISDGLPLNGATSRRSRRKSIRLNLTLTRASLPVGNA